MFSISCKYISVFPEPVTPYSKNFSYMCFFIDCSIWLYASSCSCVSFIFFVYSSHILNGLREMLILKDANISYVYLNAFKIDNMQEIIKLFKEVNKENAKESEEKINNMLEGNTDKGFLYKETIYRVKKNG